jgi:ABC-type antimicrobial peptide transport system permease subunit
MLLENVRLALRSFSSGRLRAFLSVLGIVIGVASVIAITTLGRSATYSVQSEIARAGLGTIVILPRPGRDPQLIRLFTPELANRLQHRVAGIGEVIPMNARNALIKYGRREQRGGILAVTEQLPRIFDLEVAEGRFLTPEDRARRSSVVVLGAELAGILFPTSSALGKHVRLYLNQVRSFEVVGVMESRADSMSISFDTSAYVPFETYANRVEKITRVQRYAVGVAEKTEVLEVAGRIEEFFLELTGSRTAVRLISPSTVAEMFNEISSTLNAFLAGVAAISLVVGGIGIMNIMLVSVTERTKEIGIRKALGAAPTVILGQFLTEAVTLTLAGGILGVALGTALSYWGAWLLGWRFAPSYFAYPLALAFSSSIGIFFGLYPAIRASRLDPVEALSYE